MIRILTVMLLMLSFSVTAQALEVAGVNMEQSVAVNGHILKLNGYGIRKKFFVKVYMGSLYLGKQAKRAEDAMNDSGDKVIRMNFLHSKVEKGKITEAFSEGIANNSQDVAGSLEAKRFISLFNGDFSRGDVVDLILAADGTVSVKHNNKLLGSLPSPRLAKAILAIYLGPKPADEDLKKGMLGKN